MSIYEYPPEKAIKQAEEVLRLLIVEKGLTHNDCETLTANNPCGKVTRLAAHIWTIRHKWLWPVDDQPEGHGQGQHARYFLRWDKLEAGCGTQADDLKEAALNAISRGLVINKLDEFKVWARGFRVPVDRGAIQYDLFNDPFSVGDLRRKGGKV